MCRRRWLIISCENVLFYRPVWVFLWLQKLFDNIVCFLFFLQYFGLELVVELVLILLGTPMIETLCALVRCAKHILCSWDHLHWILELTNLRLRSFNFFMELYVLLFFRYLKSGLLLRMFRGLLIVKGRRFNILIHIFTFIYPAILFQAYLCQI